MESRVVFTLKPIIGGDRRYRSSPSDMKEPIRVLVTGANGRIAYSLIPHLLSGAVFEEDQPIVLHLLSRREDQLQGLVLEIEDCVYPLHRDTVATSDIQRAFTDVDVAILLASVPSTALHRHHLLEQNTHIVQEHGRALENFAKIKVKVLIVANPCNTMTYVCRKSAPTLPDSAFSCLTQIDYNRALHQLSKEQEMNNVVILGNHSKKVVVDTSNAVVVRENGSEYRKLTSSQNKTPDIQKAVQRRGREIIEHRGQTSVLSVTAAIIEHLKAWWKGTKPDHWITMGVISDGSYGVPSGLVSSFPVQVSRNGDISIIKTLALSDKSKETLRESIKELVFEANTALVLMDKATYQGQTTLHM